MADNERKVTLLLKRGLKKDLPTLLEGEMGLATDTKELFIGSATGNVKIAGQDSVDSVLQGLQTANTEVGKVNDKIGDLSKTKERAGVSGFKRLFELARGLKVEFVGDSTSDGPAGSAQYLYEYLTRYAINSGDLLEGVNIVDRGASGNTLQNFLINIPSNRGISTIITDAPNLIVFSYGINDVRLGQRTKLQIKADLKTAVERLLKETDAYILLRIPNSFTSDDPNNTRYIQPTSSAQSYTDILWESYWEVYNEGKYSRVDIIDMQTLVFGRTVQPLASNAFMGDPLHPKKEGYYRIASLISEYIGKSIPYRKDSADRARVTNPTSPYLDYPKLLEEEKDRYDLVAQGYFVAIGDNYLDFAYPPTEAYKIQKGDIIKVGDKLAYDFSAGATSASGANTRISSGMTFPNNTNHNKGMVKVFRKKGNTVKTESVINSNISGLILKYFTTPNMRINTIDCRLAKPIATALTFRLKEIYQNTTKEIAAINFSANNMTGVVTWDATNAPNSYYDTTFGFERGALYYIQADTTTYAGEVLLNVKITN